MLNHSLSDKPVRDDDYFDALAEKCRIQESVLNATQLAVLSITTEGVITTFNRSCENLLGYSSKEVIGQTTLLVFYDRDELLKRAEALSKESVHTMSDVDVITARARNQRWPDRQEWTLIRKDGTNFPATVFVVALWDDNGNVTGFTEIISDSSVAGDNSGVIFGDEKFRLLAENIPGAIYLFKNDESYTALYLNDHIEKITGHSAQDFLSGKVAFASIFHPDDKEMVFKTIGEKLAEKKSFKVQYRLRHSSGQWRWVDEVGVGVYVDDQLTMLEGFITDITLHKEAEQKLLIFSDENDQFFNNPVSLNAISDFQGTLKRMSPSWTKLLGWSDDELRSNPFMHLVHPLDVQTTAAIFESLIDGNRVPTFENRVKSKDGQYHWLLWSAVSDVSHQTIYASAINITERKKSEETILDSKTHLETLAEKLQTQNRQLDEFAHIISHNLRAPVNNIQALINLLDQDNSGLSDYKLIFDKLKNVAKNLSETMNELMDTLKVKTKPDLDLSEIRFKEILDKVVQSLEGELIVAHASVTFDFNDAPSIQYSKPYLESIFQNLLTNAIKYRSPNRKPVIHFHSSTVNKRIELRVSDNGQGIDMALFGDSLFGLHKTFHQHAEARGVGLFLTKTQIEAMGGHISAVSEVDKGTTFIINFG